MIDEHSYQIHSWSDSVVTGASIVAFVYGWQFVAKFNDVYLYATIYIDSTSTQDIFIQRPYSFNFNTGYFCARQKFYSTSTPKVMLYEANIIYSTLKKNIFIQQDIFIQLFKFPDIDKFLFNKAPSPYPPAAPSMKTWKQLI